VYYHLKKDVIIDFNPDIILSPGGYNGFYELGICHYIKNNFTFDDKKILGISAGSWAGLFLCLNKENSNECLKNIFKQINKCCPLHKMSSIFKKGIKKYKYSDFNISNLHIGMTDLFNKNMYIHKHFLSKDDCVKACIGSSFVPYLTYNDLLYFYNNKCVVDGGFFYKNYMKNIDKNKILVINSKLFRPNYNVKGDNYIGFKKPKMNLYDLYLLGYSNARNNHKYLKIYLHSDS
jgi:hypothetical protein